jgi:hypothetical protein
MAEPKTRPNDASVEDFIASIEDPEKQQDCRTIMKLMSKATGEKPVMWGSAIVGFGSRDITYADGRVLDWPIAGFSPRKQNLTLYIGGLEQYDKQLAKLGKHSTSKACLYIKHLSDVDMDILEQMINASIKNRPSQK